MSDIEDTSGRLKMSGRYEVWYDRFDRRWAVLRPDDTLQGWYETRAEAVRVVRDLNRQE